MDGDPTVDVACTQRVRSVWVAGREVVADDDPDGAAERDCIAALHASTEKIVRGIRERWPGLPGSEGDAAP